MGNQPTVINLTFVSGMALFLRNVTFHGILLDALFEEGNSDWGTVAALLSEGIAEGAVQPLKTTVFDRDDVEDAFRFMAQGKHIGKVLIKVRWLPSPFYVCFEKLGFSVSVSAL